MKKIRMELGERSYDITVGAGALSLAGELMDLDRRVFIVTDSGVPREYAEKIKAQAKEAMIYTVRSGEGSKSLKVLEEVLTAMLGFGMTRRDAVVAVGGGVVGDLSGFAAASYMRGVDFYNVPTTLLSEVDSSIGGKCAVNLGEVKNAVGAFYQPKAVLIDTETLKTLDKRQVAAGLAEALKMSMTSDKELFSLFESGDIYSNIENIIVRSLMIKKAVVECDERESGLRRILNFGHTFGHGIEAEEGLSGLLHGECVALGMLPMCSDSVRARLIPILKKIGLPTEYKGDIKSALGYVTHDKKCEGDSVSVILVSEIGKYEIKKMTVDEFSEKILNYKG